MWIFFFSKYTVGPLYLWVSHLWNQPNNDWKEYFLSKVGKLYTEDQLKSYSNFRLRGDWCTQPAPHPRIVQGSSVLVISSSNAPSSRKATLGGSRWRGICGAVFPCEKLGSACEPKPNVQSWLGGGGMGWDPPLSL